MAIETTFSERPAVHNEGFIVVYEITLINPNTFPPVVYGFHTPIHHIAVNIIFSDSIYYTAKLSPSLLGVHDIDIKEDFTALVGFEQSTPFSEGNSHLSRLAEDVYRFVTAGTDLDEVLLSLFENPEIDWGDIGWDHDIGIIGAYSRFNCDFGILLDCLR
jgi:hypothetical protein